MTFLLKRRKNCQLSVISQQGQPQGLPLNDFFEPL
jgi:hypothetical protein